MRPKRMQPGPGQESVWDYPRPPIAVATTARVRVVHRGEVIAETTSAVRVLETSQPPAFYVPPADIAPAALVAGDLTTHCEWKGIASYWMLAADLRGDGPVREVAWSYPSPTPGFESIRDHVAFYAQRVDECWVDEERVVANDGSFYGGWITSSVVGPFKGGSGTYGW